MTPFPLLADSGFRAFKRYLAAPLGPAYARLANRLQLYPFLVILFFLEGLLSLSLYLGPAFLLDRMAFTTLYALHKALIYTLCLCAMDLLASYMPRQWGGWSQRSVGKQWLIWSAGFLLGFVVHKLFGVCLICFYAPEVMSFFLAYPQARPATTTLLLFGVTSWFAAVLVTLELVRANRSTAPSPPGGLPAETDDGARRQAPVPGAAQPLVRRVGADPAPEGRLDLQIDATPVRLAYSQITHVSVEDHYCRIFFTKGEGLDNLLVRLALKNLLQELPESSFLQIHRSHIVNLGHASGIQKRGRSHSVVLSRFALELPISRYRLAQVQPRLRAKGRGGPGLGSADCKSRPDGR